MDTRTIPGYVMPTDGKCTVQTFFEAMQRPHEKTGRIAIMDGIARIEYGYGPNGPFTKPPDGLLDKTIQAVTYHEKAGSMDYELVLQGK